MTYGTKIQYYYVITISFTRGIFNIDSFWIWAWWFEEKKSIFSRDYNCSSCGKCCAQICKTNIVIVTNLSNIIDIA
jgi:hypothetical protein